VPCSRCGKEGLKAYGFGTEKLEQELGTLFPNARVARMDTDSTRKKGRAIRILRGFAEQTIDILVGTQMITKGYNFPHVTLVGVIAADLSLAFPDFRGGERTFQILSQAAGRSGRGEQGGEVIIQTFNPDHYAVQASTRHDYKAFFEEESRLRTGLGYPPVSHLACVRLSGNSRSRTARAAEQMGSRLRGIISGWPKRGAEIQILGPTEAPIAKLKGKSRWQILVKAQRAGLVQHLLIHVDRLWRRELQAMGVQLILDVDPYQML
jgi:primosomal protein N' (replication factor Y)